MQLPTRLYISSEIAGAFLCILLLAPHTTHAAQITISITDDQFTPKSATINPGDTVVWVNNGSMVHTVTADNASFDSGVIQPGQSYSVTFPTAGSYPYHCKFHGAAGGQGMAGTITATASSATLTNSSNSSANAGPTADQLRAQAQGLLAQIATLQAQLNGSGSVNPASSGGSATANASNSSACPLIGRSLRKGASGDDVKRLQQFLAQDISVYPVYPEGIASGYFGSLTQAAVQRWQAKYHVVSSGTPDTTGYGVVGPRTAAAIAILCTTGTYNGVAGPSGSQGPVGGFISVTPVSGAGPLDVSVQATVNTTGSCSGATYTLDFGDYTNSVQQITVLPGQCGQMQQTYKHTYLYGGTFTITLSAGAHSTTATVTVSGNPFTAGLPTESFNVSPRSGYPPLTVTFSGVVNSNDQGFCTNGCGSVLDFGDGQTTTVNLPASVGSWINYSTTHTYTQNGGFKATLYQGGQGISQPIVGSATITVGTTAGTSSGIVSTPVNGTISAFTTSGAPPLNVTFYVSCVSGAAYDVVFGDGQDLGSAAVTQSTCQGGLQAIAHTYPYAGSYTAVLVVFVQQPDGAIVPRAAGSVPITVGSGGTPGPGSGGYQYSAPTLIPGNTALSFALQFDLPSACTGYRVAWGDGTGDTIQNDGGSSCAQSPQVKTVQHVYAQGGTYTIVLKRGATLSRVDDVAVTISN